MTSSRPVSWLLSTKALSFKALSIIGDSVQVKSKELIIMHELKLHTYCNCNAINWDWVFYIYFPTQITTCLYDIQIPTNLTYYRLCDIYRLAFRQSPPYIVHGYRQTAFHLSMTQDVTTFTARVPLTNTRYIDEHTLNGHITSIIS